MIKLFYSIAAMNALFSAMAWCAAKPNRLSIATLVTFAAVWPFVNGDLEGDILISIDSDSGITASDLLSVVALVIACVQAARVRIRK